MPEPAAAYNALRELVRAIDTIPDDTRLSAKQWNDLRKAMVRAHRTLEWILPARWADD